MNISPVKKIGELESEYRFRVVVFCSKYTVIFGLLFGVMLFIRPNVDDTRFSFVIMFLWFGIPMAFAVSVIAFLGYVVGWRFSLFLETNKSANQNWPKIKIIGAAIFLSPLCCFSLYWFLRGVFTMEVLAVKRHGGIHLIHLSDSTFLFWYSILLWGIMGIFGSFLILKTVINLFRK